MRTPMPRSWWDVAFVLVAALYAAMDVILSIPSGAPGRQWALNGAAVVSLGFVRCFPVPVLLVEAALFVGTTVAVPVGNGPSLLAVAGALSSVAFRHRWSVTIAAAVSVYAIVVLTVARSPYGLLTGSVGAVRGVGLSLLVITPVVSGRYIRGMREATRLAEQRAEDAERLRHAEAEAARLAERARIAGDLHDIVAHHVSAIALQAGTGHYAATHAGDHSQRLAEAVRALQSIRDNAGQALTELRSLLSVLRGPSMVQEGDGPTVEPEAMIDDAVRRTREAGLTVEAYVDSRTASAPLAVRLTAARAVQEALTNALKHAGPGAEVITRVVLEGGALCVQVTDFGSAGRQAVLPTSGHGLAAMRERVALLGGTLATGPDRTRGWHVEVSLPLPVAP